MAISITQLSEAVTNKEFITILDVLIKNSYAYNSSYINHRSAWVVKVKIPFAKIWKNANHDFIVDEYTKAGWKYVELTLPKCLPPQPGVVVLAKAYDSGLDGELKLSL